MGETIVEVDRTSVPIDVQWRVFSK